MDGSSMKMREAQLRHRAEQTRRIKEALGNRLPQDRWRPGRRRA